MAGVRTWSHHRPDNLLTMVNPFWFCPRVSLSMHLLDFRLRILPSKLSPRCCCDIGFCPSSYLLCYRANGYLRLLLHELFHLQPSPSMVVSLWNVSCKTKDSKDRCSGFKEGIETLMFPRYFLKDMNTFGNLSLTIDWTDEMTLVVLGRCLDKIDIAFGQWAESQDNVRTTKD